ncbi:hypothetical protein SAMN02910358_02357 [Lachnospiraceae bacterium XBB1006]|nr:hypothetical protein SAMN02910358_02357 [Lachnospiraceae bacterium XBB1006]
MSITRIADSVFLDIAINKKKIVKRTNVNAPVEGSFFEALNQGQYGARENSEQKKQKHEQEAESVKAWNYYNGLKDNSHWFVEESIGTKFDTVG